MSYRKLPGINDINNSDTYIDTGTPGNRAGAGLSFVPGKEVSAVVLDSNDSKWLIRGSFNTNGGEVIFDNGSKEVIKLHVTTQGSLAVPRDLILDNNENPWVLGSIDGYMSLWRIDAVTHVSTLIVNTGRLESINGEGAITYDAVRGNVWIAYYDSNLSLGVAKKYSDSTHNLLATVTLNDSAPQAMEWASSPDKIWIFTNVSGFTTTVWRINTTTDVVDFNVPNFMSDFTRNSYFNGNVGLLVTSQGNQLFKVDMSDGSALDSLNISYNSSTARLGPMVAVSGSQIDLWVMTLDRASHTFYMQLVIGADTASLSLSPIKIEIPGTSFPRKIALGTNYAIGCCCCICVCCCCCCVPSYGTLVLPIVDQDQLLEISINQNGARSSRTTDYSTFLGYAPSLFPLSMEYIIAAGNVSNNQAGSTVIAGFRTFNFYEFPESIFNLERRARLFISIEFTKSGTINGSFNLFNHITNNSVVGKSFTSTASITEYTIPLQIENNPDDSVVSGVFYRLDISLSGSGDGAEIVCYSARVVVDYA